ncbi:MAG: hypothetical protein MHM6MM_008247 [Cercozoa sp. M6MM]
MTSKQAGTFRADGPYAYLICVAVLLAAILNFSIMNSGGLFFTQARKKWPDTSAGAGAWIGGLLYFVPFTMSIVTGPLTQKVRVTYLTVAGTVICAAGLYLSALAEELWQFLLLLGGMGGIGIAFAWTPALVVLSHWFHKHRTMANAIAMSGVGLSTFIMAPLLQSWCDESFDYALRTLSTVYLIGMCTLSLVFFPRPPVEENNSDTDTDTDTVTDTDASTGDLETPLIDAVGDHGSDGEFDSLTLALKPYHVPITRRELCRDTVFVAFTVANAACDVSYQVALTHMVEYDKHFGSAERGGTLLAVFGVSSFLGRCIGAQLVASLRAVTEFRVFVASCAVLMLAYAATAWPVLGTWYFTCFVAVFGATTGAFFALIPSMLAQYFGASNLGTAMGFMFFLEAPSLLCSGAIAGYLLEASSSKSYTLPWLMASLALAIALALSFLMSRTKRHIASQAPLLYSSG